MIFGRFPSQQAAGLILAHTLRLSNRLIKKGRVLTTDDITELCTHGIDYVTGARLEVGDVTEDEAAYAIAKVLAGDSLRVSKAVAGRCNISAVTQGLTAIDRETIEAINLCGGEISIATLLPNEEVQVGQTVATVKVIPFAVAQTQVDQCCSLVVKDKVTMDEPGIGDKRQTAIEVNAFVAQRVALILTEAANVKPAVLDATRDVMHKRITSYGSQIIFEQRCEHTIDAVEKTLQQACGSQGGSDCDLILVCGATITVDVGDVIPSAIIRLGGVVEHFGMPVEPGNMLLLATCGNTTIINLPGCSRSQSSKIAASLTVVSILLSSIV